MSITVQVVGDDEMQATLKQMPAKVGVAVRKQINAGALAIQRRAIKLINKRSAGPTRTRYSNGYKRRVVVSLPNQAPNNDTGNLRKNIVVSYGSRVVTKGYTAIVSSKAKYGAALEKGAPRRNLKKRPYMKPAADMERKQIIANVKKAVLGALKL